MIKYLIILLISLIQPSMHAGVNGQFIPDYSKKTVTANFLSKALGPANIVVAIGGLIHSWFHGKQPSNKWNIKKWEHYFKKKFSSCNQNNYTRNVIHYYDGYQYYSFCEMLIGLCCDECYFDDLKNFINPNYTGYYPNTAVRSYYNNLSERKQNEFKDGVKLVLRAKGFLDKDRTDANNNDGNVFNIIMPQIKDANALSTNQHQELSNSSNAQTASMQQLKEEYAIAVDFIPDQIRQARICGFNAGSTIITKDYAISDHVQNVLQSHNVSVRDYQICIGCELQQIIHAECITIAEHIAENRITVNNLIIDFLEIGRQENQSRMISGALKALDVCWAILHCAGKATKAVVEGSFQGAFKIGESIGDFIIAPDESIQDFVKSIQHAAVCIVNFIKSHPPAVNILLNHNQQNLQQTIAEQLFNAGDALRIYIQQHPYESIKEGSSLLTQQCVTNKAFSILSKFFTTAHEKIPTLLDIFKKEIPILKVEEIPTLIAAESSSLLYSIPEKPSNYLFKVTEKAKENTPRPIIKVQNMKEFFELDFGKLIKDKVIKIKGDRPYYRVIKDMDNYDLVNGDCFYLDKLHYDHLEVFKKNGKIKSVLNLDGTMNYEKTIIAKKQCRKIKI